MAPHTSPAAPHRHWRALLALALLLGCANAPAGASEQVYIWRDASGQLRFDAVQAADAHRPPAVEARAVQLDDSERAPIVLTGSTQPGR
ncbi:MAG: hypothetical protein ACRERC_17295 [Candidatus Binatia bacterium]